MRLTVDTPEDYALVKAIFEELYPRDPASASTRSSRCSTRGRTCGAQRRVQQKPAR